jgi:hypothetical protein
MAEIDFHFIGNRVTQCASNCIQHLYEIHIVSLIFQIEKLRPIEFK